MGAEAEYRLSFITVSGWKPRIQPALSRQQRYLVMTLELTKQGGVA